MFSMSVLLMEDLLSVVQLESLGEVCVKYTVRVHSKSSRGNYSRSEK